MNRIAWWVIGGLAGLYAANVAANTFYRALTHDQVAFLESRIAGLARIDRNDPQIDTIRKLVADADYHSFTALAPFAIPRRFASTTYLRQHPHLALGIAVDGNGLTDREVGAILKQINQRFRPHDLSVGLAEPVVRINIPAHSTRDDIFHGVTSVFAKRHDYHIALTTRTCRYTTRQRAPSDIRTNRIYSFGRKGLAVVSNAASQTELADRLAVDLARFLTGNRVEKNWLASDYARTSENVLRAKNITGSLARENQGLNLPDTGHRTVSVTIARDAIGENVVPPIIAEANRLFAPYNVSFVIRHTYEHQLEDTWTWPHEIRRMQSASASDIYVLLTPTEWISPERGRVRGLGSAFFGAIMVQVGSPRETTRRLLHELGHLFELPHTFLEGHIMYPNESHIGLSWSPGSRRRLAENGRITTWHSTITYRRRFDIAIRQARPLTRHPSPSPEVVPSDPPASPDAWAACG